MKQGLIERVQALHKVYCEITLSEGFSMRFGRDRLWFAWLQNEWSEDDLRLVVRYLRRGITEGKRNPGALKFSNLIGMPDKFEEDLLEARRVLGQRPPKPQTVPAKQALPGGGERAVEKFRDSDADVVDVGKAFEAMRKELSSNPASELDK